MNGSESSTQKNGDSNILIISFYVDNYIIKISIIIKSSMTKRLTTSFEYEVKPSTIKEYLIF